MRRKEKEILDRKTIDTILENAQVMRLALALNNEPYLVPLSYGYDGAALYFHCARHGKKIDFLRNSPNVCFEVEYGVKLAMHDENPCSWGFHFQCVIGRGKAVELTDAEEKRAALSRIMAQYSDQEWNFPDASLAATMVWKIEIAELTGKQG